MDKPHRLNVIGDFYVADQCCTLCGVPQGEAPSLFADTEDENHCYVKKQPETPEEFQAMLRVLRYQEFDCVRYHGKTPKGLLSAMGETACSDEGASLHPPEQDAAILAAISPIPQSPAATENHRSEAAVVPARRSEPKHR
jgi:hypothetical protein